MGLMTGKKGIIFGVSNTHGIAYAIAQQLFNEGADILAYDVYGRVRIKDSVEGGYLDYFLFAGDSMKDVLMAYTDLTGKPSLPAPWTFGLWLSTSFTTSYDEATVMSFIDGMLERGIPLRTFHFDCCWMKEFHWSDFVWDERVFPDPEGMLKRIKEKGLNICVWINSYIGQESKLFAEGIYGRLRIRGHLHQPSLIIGHTVVKLRGWNMCAFR